MVYQVYGGCVVVDTENKSIKSLHIPVILDQVTDRVRSRVYSLVLTLLVIVATAFWGLGPAFRSFHSIVPFLDASEIDLILPSSLTVSYGGTLYPPPTFLVLGSDGTPISGRSVTLYAESDLSTSTYPLSVSEFYNNDALNSGLILPIMKGNLTLNTDRAGIVQFSNISFFGNSKISYVLYCLCDDVISGPIGLTVTTNVGSLQMEVLPRDVLYTQTGQVIDFTFVVQVFDIYGNVLPGVNVVAALDPFPGPQAVSPRYGIVTGNTSVTDVNGLAYFNSLAIVLATHTQVSLIFDCQGVLLKPLYSQLPIIITTDVASVEIFHSASTIAEGETISDIVINILDSRGNTIQNKKAIAMMTMEVGVPAYPHIFNLSKTLENPTTFSYLKNGMMKFTELKFTADGRAGQYGITFFCDGIPSVQMPIEVYTTVGSVMWSSVPTAITIFQDAVATVFPVLVVSVADTFNKPINNKIVKLSAVYSWGRGDIQETITSNGIATFVFTAIPYVELGANETTGFLSLICECDGVTVEEVANISISFIRIVRLIPTYVQVILPPSGTYSTANSNMGFQPLLRIVDYKGDPCAGVQVMTNITSSLENTNGLFPPLYLDIFVRDSFRISGSGVSNSSGYVQFGADGNSIFAITSGYTATIPIAFYILDEYNVSTTISNIILVQVYSPIVEMIVNYQHPPGSMNMEVSPNTIVDLSISVFLDSTTPELQNTYASILVLEGTEISKNSSMSLFYGFGTTYAYSDSRVNSNWLGYTSPLPCNFALSKGGCWFGDMMMFGYPGTYTVAAIVAGVLSPSITISVGENVYKLVVDTPPPLIMKAWLQAYLPFTPTIQVLDGYGNPAVGIHLRAVECKHSPDVQLVNYVPGLDCQDCALSSASDENGTAVFDSLKFVSGAFGQYKICIYTVPENFIVWDVEITLQNPVYNVFLDKINQILTPGSDLIASLVDIYDMDFLISPLEVKFVQLSGSSELSVIPVKNFIYPRNTDAIVQYTVTGPSGYYTAALNFGGAYRLNFTFLIDSVVTYLSLLDSNLDPLGVVTTEVMSAFTVVVCGMTHNGDYVDNLSFSTSIASQPAGSSAEFELTETTINSYLNYKYLTFFFTSGSSGLYEIEIAYGIITSSMYVNLTNPIVRVMVKNFEEINSSVVVYNRVMPFQPIISLVPLTNQSNMQGKPVNAFLQNYTNSVSYQLTPFTDLSGTAEFSDLSIIVGDPGYYQLVFVVDGVLSDPVTIYLTNPAYPDYEHLNLHHTQQQLVLAVLLVIPLFIGNSDRQPFWQLVLSVPAFFFIGYIAYENLFDEITVQGKLRDKGFAYFGLDLALRAVLILSVLMYLFVVIRTIYAKYRKRPTSFFESKMHDCHLYIRHELLSYGMKRYYENLKPKILVVGPHELSILQRLQIWYLRYRGHAIPEREPLLKSTEKKNIQDQDQDQGQGQDKKTKKREYTGFRFPQRMVIAVGASLMCTFFMACGTYIVTLLVIKLATKFQTKIESIIAMAKQLLDFTNGTAGSISNPDTLNAIATILGVSNSQFTTLFNAAEDSAVQSLYYTERADAAVILFKTIFYSSSLISLLLTTTMVLVAWLLVTRTYKERIFLLRQGKINLITRNPDKFLMGGAVTYVGLQAVHSTFAFLIFWFITTCCICVLQLKVFWLWVWSYFPVLVAFIIGLPFISKTISKFIVAIWIVKKNEIKHFRMWLIFDFMWIFVNLLSSMVLSMLRFGFAVFSSIVYAMRMDTALLREEFDYMDFGYKAYMGMLVMDHKNNNPILLVLIEHFLHGMKQQRQERKERVLEAAKKASINNEDVPIFTPVTEEPVRPNNNNLHRQRIINKWWLFVTLHNNPTLQAMRKH